MIKKSTIKIAWRSLFFHMKLKKPMRDMVCKPVKLIINTHCFPPLINEHKTSLMVNKTLSLEKISSFFFSRNCYLSLYSRSDSLDWIVEFLVFLMRMIYAKKIKSFRYPIYFVNEHKKRRRKDDDLRRWLLIWFMWMNVFRYLVVVTRENNVILKWNWINLIFKNCLKIFNLITLD